ncbi:hypothetical protein MNBD_GAMMA22-1908 [hydrothermal vent metagenome]|uniref:SPOR domain-containing protein n=1 Tax=hydrothermal vent metagenome TaxID=652676 RepID=A0A3B1A743_9ZZZZ
MKWLIYSLLLVNLGMFVWHYQSPSSEVIKQSEQLVELPKLVLLREVLPDSRSQKRFPDTSSSKPEQKHCYRLGPFIGKKSVKTALGLLNRRGIMANQSSYKENNKDGFWVFIPPSSSRKKAKDIIVRFKAIGEKHFFLVASGEFKNAISLGLFSLRKHANSRLKEMKNLGFGAAMRNVNLPKSLFWLDWERDPEHHISREVFINLREQFKDIGQVEVLCSSLAAKKDTKK